MAMSLAKQARNVANAGRMGDSQLLHVNPVEMAGIASTVPMTQNPQTGQPEAFLPFLLGAAAPALGGAAGITGALAPALLGAGGTLAGSMLQGDSLKEGMLNAMAGFAGGLAGPALGAMTGGAGGAGAAPAAAKAMGAAPATTDMAKAVASRGIGAVPGAAGMGANAMPPSVASRMPMATPKPMMGANAMPPSVAAARQAAPGPMADRGPGGGIGGFIKNNPGLAIGGAMAAAPLLDRVMGSGGSGGGKGSSYEYRKRKAERDKFSPAPDPMGRERRHFSPTRFFAEGGAVSSFDQEVVAEAIAAIRGQHPSPREAIAKFIKEFGPEMFERLLMKVTSEKEAEGGVQGPGDGKSDSVAASMPDGGPAQLSDGEYVVPSDVVSGLGNGSTNAGIASLDKMKDNVRASRTGIAASPRRVAPEMLMPG